MASQEDDATELQFPKDYEIYDYSYANSFTELTSNERCYICKAFLEVPYIECHTCLSMNTVEEGNLGKICLWCLAKGNEANVHKSDHDYIINKQNFSIFNKNWQAKEELQLLNGIMECGLGNWIDISKYIGNKSPSECKKHYFETFIEYPLEEFSILLQKSNENCLAPFTRSIYSNIGCKASQNSVAYHDLAGYNAARNDFVIEHLNDAEQVLCDIDPTIFEDEEDSSLGQELESALLDIYKNCLQERHLRKKIINEHGLMDIYKSNQRFNYCRSHFPELTKLLLPKLYALMTHEELTYLVEGLQSHALLQKQILELKEYRDNGLTRNTQTCIYRTLKKQREVNFKRKHKLKFGPNGKEINIEDLSKLCLRQTNLPPFMKRISVPLNISREPFYHTLTEEEKRISSAMRIVPKNFNRFKATMIEECRKYNGLKLWQARLLFKIDVNKIRILYNYLMKEGFIY